MVNGIITKGRSKLETEVKCLEREVRTLKTAIEEAIMKGQKSLAVFTDVPESGVVFDEDLGLTCGGTGSGVVGWVDDF
jgi:seryl-tRNA synthetase